jgi:phospholipase/carboxylesterase
VDLIHAHYQPAGNGPHPTIVALHGWGANALDLLGLAPYLAGGRFQVVCPQGAVDVPLDGALGFGWFPLSSVGRVVEEGSIERAAHALEAFLAEAGERYTIDARKLVLLGFSQGGVMAYRLALANPSRFAALAALSSWLPPQLVDTLPANDGRRQLVTLVQHGEHDETITVARARQSVETLRGFGVPLTYREYPMGHEISGPSLMDLSAWLAEKIV